MTAKFYTNTVKLFSENLEGNDYVVGDIHGRYDLIVKALQKMKFNEKKDRLFCVGDLIDRGAYSEFVLDFLQKPYVHAVRGNHEDMLLELYDDGNVPSKQDLIAYSEEIGLTWWLGVEPEKQRQILQELRKLPIAIEVQLSKKIKDKSQTSGFISKIEKVGLVHADIPLNIDWNQFTQYIEQGVPNIIAQALWGRTRLSYNVKEKIEHVDRVYVGHTVQSKAKTIGNIVALDTGAVFNQHLTIINLLCDLETIEKAHRPLGNVQIINYDNSGEIKKDKKSYFNNLLKPLSSNNTDGLENIVVV